VPPTGSLPEVIWRAMVEEIVRGIALGLCNGGTEGMVKRCSKRRWSLLPESESGRALLVPPSGSLGVWSRAAIEEVGANRVNVLQEAIGFSEEIGFRSDRGSDREGTEGVLPSVFHVVDHFESREVPGRGGREGRVKSESGGESGMVRVKGEIKRDSNRGEIERGGSQGVNEEEVEYGRFMSRGSPPGRRIERVQAGEVL
jgi:hypothetical protein